MTDEQIDIFTQKYFDLCSDFANFCFFQFKGDETICVKDIPEAVEKMNNAKEFERFVEKYFNLVWDQNIYRFKRKE